MARICPKDFKVCVDDLCRGSGVCLRTGDYLLDECPRCHQPVSPDIDCGCPTEDDDFEDYGDEY